MREAAGGIVGVIQKSSRKFREMRYEIRVIALLSAEHGTAVA